jgi:uncharacterized protein (DUF2235 family)
LCLHLARSLEIVSFAVVPARFSLVELVYLAHRIPILFIETIDEDSNCFWPAVQQKQLQRNSRFIYPLRLVSLPCIISKRTILKNMGKNVIVCCDGTANEFAQNNTNVVHLYSMLVHDQRQVAYYHPGLGTMEAAGALTTFSRKVTKVAGLAFGYGLATDIRDAYIFVMQNYEVGDRLFLFGFSRGAYTARAVASLLKMFGLIRKGNETLVPYAIRMMNSINRARSNNSKDQQAIARYFELAKGFRETMSTECKPHFMGVWDTVSSVGWIDNPLKLPYIANNPDIQIGRHAIAIDERRAFFRNHLWRRPDNPAAEWGPQDVKQVWFSGVHCDVGGGYPESESGLSKIALQWMIRHAELNSLLVNAPRVAEVLGSSNHYVRPDTHAQAHESLKGWWNLAEVAPKEHFDWNTKKTRRHMNLWSRRTIPPQSLIHESAFDRKDLPQGAIEDRTP